MAGGEAALRIELIAGDARADVMPGMGGALAGLRVGDRCVLKPWTGRPDDGPFALSNIVLAPFSNRISRPFVWLGKRIALERNLETEAFPIHGDAFQKAWTIIESRTDQVVMQLKDGAFGALRYEASLTYALSSTGLRCELALTSRADDPMPFGLGFHPQFPRDQNTRLEFTATGVWEEDGRHLPLNDNPIEIPPAWDFSVLRPIPETWINNGFDGWSGTAKILQGDSAMSVTMQASSNLGTLVIYSPDPEANFFCAEPVSHPVDAHNLRGLPGLAILEPGATLAAQMEFQWGQAALNGFV